MNKGNYICPNCSAVWGNEEIDWGQCDCCGYPDLEQEKDDEFSEDEGAYDDYLDSLDGNDDDEIIGDTICPSCKTEYDQIDYEYQVCHLCKHNNNAL